MRTNTTRLLPVLFLLVGSVSVPAQEAGVVSLPERVIPQVASPSLILQGDNTDKREAELRAWFREQWRDRCPADDFLFRGFCRRLAANIVLDANDRQRIDPEAWQAAVGQFNACIALFDSVRRSRAPEPFKHFLATRFARFSVERGATLDIAGWQERLSNVPAGSKAVAFAGNGRESLAQAVEAVDPGSAKRPPLARKLLMDALAGLNPAMRSDGFQVVKGLVRERACDVAVPLRTGAWQVFVYEIVETNGVLLIPPSEWFHTQASAPGRLDLRDFRDFDLANLKGMAPVEVDLAYTGQSDLGPLAGIPSLRRLSVAGLPLGNLDFVRGLSLESLDLSRTAVSNLAPLEGMPLKRLDLSHTQVSDLSPLASVPLEFLDVSATPVAHLSPLARMPLKAIQLSRIEYGGKDTLRGIASLETISDYAPGEWFAAQTNAMWFEPTGMSVGRAGSCTGGTLEISFTPEQSGHPCDHMTYCIRFRADGTPGRAWVTRPPDVNIVVPFVPKRVLSAGDGLTVTGGPRTWRDELRRDTVLNFSIDGKFSGDRFAGTFTLSYDTADRNVVTTRVVKGSAAGVLSRMPDGNEVRAAPDWPAWRGATGGGVAAAPAGAMVESLGVASLKWVSDVGVPGTREPDALSSRIAGTSMGGVSGGYSAPVLHRGRLYVYYYRPAGEAFDRQVTARQVRSHGWGRDKWRIEADDVVVCVDAASGAFLWERVMPRKGLNLNAGNAGDGTPLLTPCAAEGRVFAAGTGGRVYALDAGTGAVLWETTVGYRAEALEQVRAVALRDGRLPVFPRDFGTSPVVVDGVVVCPDHSDYVGGGRSEPGGLLGIDAATGRRLWRVPAACGITASPVPWVSGGRGYVLASSDKVRCVEVLTGRIAWELPGAYFRTVPALSGDILVCNGARDEGATAWRLGSSGARKLWSAGRENAIGVRAPVAVADKVLIPVRDRLVAFDLQTGAAAGTATGLVQRAATALTAMGERVFVEGMQMFQCDAEGVRLLGGMLPDTMAPGSTPALSAGFVFLRGAGGLLCYDLRQGVADSDRGMGVLMAMLTGPDGRAAQSAAVTLYLKRGEDGRRAILEKLAKSLSDSDVETHSRILNAMNARELQKEAADMLAAAALEAMRTRKIAFYGSALRIAIGADPATRLEARRLIVENLEGDAPQFWDSSAQALYDMGDPKAREVAVDAMAPKVGGTNASIRAHAMRVMMHYGAGVRSKPHRERMAAALFAAWKSSAYRDDQIAADFSEMGRDAGAHAAEIKKYIQDQKDVPTTMFRVLRAIAPDKAATVGPSLDAEPKTDKKTDDLGL